MLELLLSAFLNNIQPAEGDIETNDRKYEWLFDPMYATPEKNWIIGEYKDIPELAAMFNMPQSNRVLGFHRRTVTPDGEEPMSEIWLPPNAPQWLREHEQRHAKGWRHPYRPQWGRWQ